MTPAHAYYRPDEYAVRWRLSRRTVYRRIAAGEIHTVKEGGAIRIPRDEWCRHCKGTGGCEGCEWRKTK